jgi:hypothetical protein
MHAAWSEIRLKGHSGTICYELDEKGHFRVPLPRQETEVNKFCNALGDRLPDGRNIRRRRVQSQSDADETEFVVPLAMILQEEGLSDPS